MRPLDGQMTLDLFPEERPKARAWRPFEDTLDWLINTWHCPEDVVRPYVERCFGEFTETWEAVDRAQELKWFFSAGRRRQPGCAPEELGMFDHGIDYHVFWDRCWAALWIGPEEAKQVMEWHYNYRQPYTGAPAHVWYIDNHGREVRRPYEG